MSFEGDRDLEELIAAFLAAVAGYSLREAAKLTGVPHATIGELRKGLKPRLQPSTQRKMQDFVDRKRTESSVERKPGAGYRLLREYLDATPEEQASFLRYLAAIRAAEE